MMRKSSVYLFGALAISLLGVAGFIFEERNVLAFAILSAGLGFGAEWLSQEIYFSRNYFDMAPTFKLIFIFSSVVSGLASFGNLVV